MPDRPWKQEERRVAKEYGGKRVALSGSNNTQAETQSDVATVVLPHLFIEVKSWARIPMWTLWLKVQKLAREENRAPVLVVHKKGSPHRVAMLTVERHALLEKACMLVHENRVREAQDVTDVLFRGQSEFVTIEVTNSDIFQAQHAQSGFGDPVTIAVDRVLGLRSVLRSVWHEVDGGSGLDIVWMGAMNQQRLHVPPQVVDWLALFKKGESVDPFSFQIRRPTP